MEASVFLFLIILASLNDFWKYIYIIIHWKVEVISLIVSCTLNKRKVINTDNKKSYVDSFSSISLIEKIYLNIL